MSIDQSGINPWRVMAAIGGAVLLATLNFSVIFVAFDSIIDDLGTTEATASWALTAFTITTGALTIPAGWLADRHGRKPMLLVGMAVFIAGSTIVAAAPGPIVLVAGRIVQAAGLSTESIAALALLLDVFGPERRSTAIGGMGAIGGVAAALGPSVGGVLLDSIGWRATFALNIPLGLVLLMILVRHVPDIRHDMVDRGRPDALGIGVLVAGSVALALGVVRADAWGYGSWRLLVTLALGIGLLAAVVLRSRSHPNPILVLPLYRDRAFRLGSMLTFVVAGSFGGLYLAWVHLLTTTWDYSLARAGLGLSAIPLLAGPLSFVAGRLADRHGHRAVILPGAILQALAAGLLLLTVGDEPSMLGVWLPVALVYGTGVGLAHSACHASAMTNVATERLGIGGAMSRIAMDAGMTFSVAVVVAIIASADVPLDATRRSAMVLLAVGVLGAVLASRLPSRSDSAAR